MFTITAQKLIPAPLCEKIIVRQSEIWDKEIVFEQPNFYKIKAPSGTGKTTLIHTLYGLRNDFSGTVLYNNKDFKTLSAEQIAILRQKEISIIFQDLQLFENLTALENIQLKMQLHPAFITETEMLEMANALGIQTILQQPIKICSYGEQQRIAILRALVQPFQILLMDEPFSHLDNANAIKAAKLIAKACKKRNAGFVLTDLDDDNYFEYNQYFQL